MRKPSFEAQQLKAKEEFLRTCSAYWDEQVRKSNEPLSAALISSNSSTQTLWDKIKHITEKRDDISFRRAGNKLMIFMKVGDK